MLVVLEKLPDAGRKPGQMTSGVPFHYVENVKAQLSQWLYPWCKGNSVISLFFLPLFFPSDSSSAAGPLQIFIETAKRSFVFHVCSDAHIGLVFLGFRDAAFDKTGVDDSFCRGFSEFL